MKDERFIVTYRIEADTYEDAKSIAWAVQVEQTIEFPYEFVTDPYIKIQLPVDWNLSNRWRQIPHMQLWE